MQCIQLKLIEKIVIFMKFKTRKYKAVIGFKVKESSQGIVYDISSSYKPSCSSQILFTFFSLYKFVCNKIKKKILELNQSICNKILFQICKNKSLKKCSL